MTDADETKDLEATDPAAHDRDSSDAETASQPIVEPPTRDEPAPRAGIGSLDRRALGIGAGAMALLVAVFVAGMAVGGDERDHTRGSFAAAREGQTGPGGPGGHMQQREGMHGRGMRGEGGRGMRGESGPGGPGMRGGEGMQGGEGVQGEGMRGGRGMHAGARQQAGGMGVVASVSDDELEVEPLRGGADAAFTVELDDDTKVYVHGDAGPRDLEDADVDDIEEGDIVMVRRDHGDRDDSGDDASGAAKAVVIVRAADE